MEISRMRDLFEAEDEAFPAAEYIDEGVLLLRGFVRTQSADLMTCIAWVESKSPFRNMQTPGGYTMSAAMTNCGQYGWITDAHGYRYAEIDPLTRQPWPEMPHLFLELAKEAAAVYGFEHYAPDVCLINRYEIGAKMSLHQDNDERDLSYPIVSVSLGLPAIYQLGGMDRRDEVVKIPLNHGDVLILGGVARLRYHGVMPIKSGVLPDDPEYRYNLTFRRAK